MRMAPGGLEDGGKGERLFLSSSNSAGSNAGSGAAMIDWVVSVMKFYSWRGWLVESSQ
jgi:hypothetical protein